MAPRLAALLLLSAALPSVRPAARQAVLPRFPGLPSIDDLTRAAGVKASHWLVETEDGYQVMVHRLGNSSGPAVLLQHGLLNAADIWLVRGRDSDLALLLVKEGYDVYLGNFRGNAFSKHHARLRPTDLRYWDFSFHESGYYDVPAMVDWILESRGLDKLSYIGHSLGTTVFFVMCSTRPEYNTKIQAAALISPVAHFPDPSEFAVAFIRAAAVNRHTLWRSFRSARWVEFAPRTASGIKAIREFCEYRRPTQDYCLDLYGMYLGEHRANIDRKKIGYYLTFSPAGTSFKTLYHLGQMVQTTEFTQLDLGPAANLDTYNSTTPPSYELERITAPVAIFWSSNDNLISEKSVRRITPRLQNLILVRHIPDPKFTHGDVFFGLNAKEVLYEDVVATLGGHR